MSIWSQNLNPEQQAAVAHSHGPLLILAGAGSGKTTVLVARTGRLIGERIAAPERIGVLTFTNKAATELKVRVGKRLGEAANKVWAGTFHGFGLRFLKDHWREAGLPAKFGVIDGNDAQAIVKDLLRDHKATEKDGIPVDRVLAKINYLRETGSEKGLDDSVESALAITLKPKFQQRMRQLGVVDFEDLLLRPLQLAKENSLLKEKLQSRFDFVMVDEFQDTNLRQMELVDLLSTNGRNIAVVGDDDQSIYGWRGAEVKNILEFPRRYKGCEVVRLERNYRSTPEIIELANAIIAQNTTRHAKVLKPCQTSQGQRPELFIYENEDEEVDQVIQEIAQFHRQGTKWKNIAVLYRSNAQGGLMEGGLRRSGIPYKLTGGSALFDRKEVKDAMAFIRSSVAPNEVTFRRILNLPPRGIGEKTITDIEEMTGSMAFHQKVKVYGQRNSHESIAALFTFLEKLKERLVHAPMTAEQVLDSELREIGYYDYVRQSYREPGAGDKRWSAVLILGRILDGMFVRHGRNVDTLEMFVDAMELRDVESEEEKAKADEVQLMTLHACKGLEFPVVFLLGLEEDLLPHAKLGQNVDEERRLFYVGVTRAQQRLIMSRVRQRKRYGRLVPVSPSRFLAELKAGFIVEFQGNRPLAAADRVSRLDELKRKLDRQIAAGRPPVGPDNP